MRPTRLHLWYSMMRAHPSGFSTRHTSATAFGSVVQDTPRVDQVESLIGKAQGFGVAYREPGRQAEEHQPAASVLDRQRGEIDSVKLRASFGESLMVSPQAHADLQNPQPACLLEPRELGDIGFQLVPSARLPLICRAIHAREVQLLPACSPIPELIDLLLAHCRPP
jgi:hypothetical protein